MKIWMIRFMAICSWAYWSSRWLEIYSYVSWGLWLLHLGIFLTRIIIFWRHREVCFYPVDLFCPSSGHSICVAILKKDAFQASLREGDLRLGLCPACLSQPVPQVSFPPRSTATRTSEWNRAPNTHKSPAAQTICGAALYPVRSMNAKEFIFKFYPKKSNLPNR